MMLTREELADLYRELRDSDVLSVFLDGGSTDPAERRAWRLELENRLGEERSRLEGSSPEKLPAFDVAREHIMGELASVPAFLPDRGWVGFATEAALRHGESVPFPMPNFVRWERGIRVAPYVRGLKQDRVVVVTLVDRRRARVFTYRHGVWAERADLIREPIDGDIADANVAKRAGRYSGVRGETSTDAARAAVDAHAERLKGEVAAVVESLAGTHGLVVIGGTTESVSALAVEMAHLDGRVIQRTSMHFEMGDADLRIAAEEAASELGRTLQATLLDSVIDLAHSGGKGCLGAAATQTALRERRVDTLLITRALRERDPDFADQCVGAAIEQSSSVEELSGPAAERLEAEGEGVGARLRYTMRG